MDQVPSNARILDEEIFGPVVALLEVHSFEEAAEARQQLAGQIIRSILFRVGEDEFVMALVAGPAGVARLID